MKAVVTGGAGFIASHITNAYVEDGYEVHIIDDFSTGQKANLDPRAEVHTLDISAPEASGLLRKLKPTVLNHPAFDARTNILGFVNLLESAKEVGVKKVIFSSSGGAVYGDQEPIPANEEHATLPLSPYGVSKLAGELYLRYYHSAFGLPYVALRYANVYGPRQSSKGEAGVVAIFISRLLAGEPPVINGDGRQTRDYVYVADVVRANRGALATSYVGAINIGTGKETDVVTIFQGLRAGLATGIDAVYGPAKPGEQRRSCLDISLARKVLGWFPEVDLQSGLERTIAYYRDAH